MTPENLILVGVAAVALAAAVAAFAIAWRRSSGDADWRRSLQRETVEADRHRPVEVPPVPTAAEEPEGEPAAEGAPEPQPAEPEAAEREPAGVAVATEQRLVEVSPEEAGVTRRQFFNRALSASFFTFLGVLSLEFLGFLWPRLSGGFGADVVAGKVSDLLDEATNDDGTITPVFIPEGRAYVVPTPEAIPPVFQDKGVVAGGVFALYQRCVHLGCRVPWCGTSQGFECPCHGSKYSSIGEYFAGPAPRNLDRFVVELTDTDELIIKTGQIVQTPRSLQLAVSYPQGPSCIGDIGGGEA